MKGLSATYCACILFATGCSRTSKPPADDTRIDPWEDIRNDVKSILTPVAGTIANSKQGDSIKYESDVYGTIYLCGHSRDDYPPETRVIDLSSKNIQGFLVLTVKGNRLSDIRFQCGAPGAGIYGPINEIDDIYVSQETDHKVSPIVRPFSDPKMNPRLNQ